jgi:hypothetical protein
MTRREETRAGSKAVQYSSPALASSLAFRIELLSDTPKCTEFAEASFV